MVTLADLKDAVEWLAIGQVGLSLAMQPLMTEETERAIGAERMDLLKKSLASSAKHASDVFEKLFALEPKV